MLYNNLALPTEMNLGNNTRTTYGYWDMGGQYDTSGGYYSKLWKIKTVKDPTGTPTTLQEVKHTWDAIGNLTQRENVADTETESFAYDFLDRLTSESNFMFKFGDTGDASSKVNNPSKAAVDSSGNIQVADMSNTRVARFNSSGVYQSSFGSSGYGDGQFIALGGITIDSDGNIYTTEWLGNHRVQKFNSSGVFQTKWGTSGSGDGQFNGARDIVFNPANNYLYVADRSNHRIQYFDTSGNYQGQWGTSGTGDGQFNGPWGVGVDSSGNIYVADTSNHRIQKFSSTGTWSATWGSSGSGNGQFNMPRDVAVDSSGNVYVMDTDNYRVQKLNSSGAFITAFGSNGTGQGQFSNPYGIALTSSRIYVVDTSNSRLQTFDSGTTSGWAYNQIGNMTSRDGVAYGYGSGWSPPLPPQPHAVRTLAGSSTYSYDYNGNMTSRPGQTLTWDVENRLTGITGGVSYVYDGNGFRIKKTENGVTILYASKYYEKNTSTGTVTLYYYLGDKLVAYKSGSDLKYIHQDHLTGTSITTTNAGLLDGSIKYKPYGETRSSSGGLPSQKFTGQRLDDVGLYYYNARYYDPGLGRFISADTIIPNWKNPQSWNRYAYVLNNPLKYIDPDGRIAWLAIVSIAIAVVNYASTAYDAHQFVKEPSLENLGWLALNFVDPSPVPWGAGRKAAKELGKLGAKEVAEQAQKLARERSERVLREKGRAIHHMVPWENQRFRQAYDKILNKYKLDIQGEWNKIEIPQDGRHPDEYHKWVLEQLTKIDELAKGDTKKFLELFDVRIKAELEKDPGRIFKEYYTANPIGHGFD